MMTLLPVELGGETYEKNAVFLLIHHLLSFSLLHPNRFLLPIKHRCLMNCKARRMLNCPQKPLPCSPSLIAISI